MLKILKKKSPSYKGNEASSRALMQLIGESREVKETCKVALARIDASLGNANGDDEGVLPEKIVALYLKLAPMLIKLQEHEVALLREQQAADEQQHTGNRQESLADMRFTAVDKLILQAALKEWEAGEKRVEEAGG